MDRSRLAVADPFGEIDGCIWPIIGRLDIEYSNGPNKLLYILSREGPSNIQVLACQLLRYVYPHVKPKFHSISSWRPSSRPPWTHSVRSFCFISPNRRQASRHTCSTGHSDDCVQRRGIKQILLCRATEMSSQTLDCTDWISPKLIVEDSGVAS